MVIRGPGRVARPSPPLPSAQLRPAPPCPCLETQDRRYLTCPRLGVPASWRLGVPASWRPGVSTLIARSGRRDSRQRDSGAEIQGIEIQDSEIRAPGFKASGFKAAGFKAAGLHDPKRRDPKIRRSEIAWGGGVHPSTHARTLARSDPPTRTPVTGVHMLTRAYESSSI
jgi:hypothetical protein